MNRSSVNNNSISNNRYLRFIKCHTIICVAFIIMCITLLLDNIAYADSMENSVSTLDEFYTEVSRQILAHKKQQTYYIASNDLLNTISNKNGWNNFEFHYNEKEPLCSGCYTCRQSFDGNMSWFSTNSRTVSVTFNYYVPKDTMDNYFSEMKQLATELKGENDFISVKNVHDYITKRVEYDYSSAGTNYTDIEGFRENKMVCQGYSMATFVLLSYMNIPVRIVIGDAGDEKDYGPHAWNIVKVDGKWYNYDATWDDSEQYGTHYTYFLKSNDDFPMHYPKDIYASSEFTSMISTESYKLPFQMTDFKLFPLLIFDVLVAIIIIRITIKRRRGDYYTINTTVIDDDFVDNTSFADEIKFANESNSISKISNDYNSDNNY